MPMCAIKGCLNYKGATRRNYKFKSHRFPRNEDVCKQWATATGQPDRIKVTTARICSEHFAASSYKIPKINALLNYHPISVRYLKEDAVPTLKLPVLDIISRQNTESESSNQTSLENVQTCTCTSFYQTTDVLEEELELLKDEMPSCAVKGCDNFNGRKARYGFKFYRFPRHEEMYKQWVTATGRTDKFNIKTARICSEHFARSCIEIAVIYQMCKYHPKSVRYLKKDAVPTLKLPFIHGVDENWSENLENISANSNLDGKGQSPNLEVIPVKECDISNPINSGSKNSGEIIQEIVNEVEISSKQNVSKQNLEKCRLCLCLAELHPVTDAQFEKYTSNFIHFIQVQLGYKLPERVCEDCIIELCGIASFIKKCKDSHKILEKTEGKSENAKPSHLNDTQIGMLDHLGYINTDKIDLIRKTKDNSNCEPVATSFNNPLTNGTCNTGNVIRNSQELGTGFSNPVTQFGRMSENCNAKNVTSNLQQVTSFYDPVSKLILFMSGNSNSKNICSQKLVTNGNGAVTKLVTTAKNSIPKNVNSISQQVTSFYDPASKLILFMTGNCNAKNININSQRLTTAFNDSVTKCDTATTNSSTKKIRKKVLKRTVPSDAPKVVSKKAKTTKTKDAEELKTCKKCGEVIKTTKADHYKMSKSCYPAKYKCSVCNAFFKSHCVLKNHQRAHHWTVIPQSRLMCHLCPQFFKYESSLRRHMDVHKYGKAHTCDVCGKSYTTPGQLKDHLNIHTNSKPYRCRYCEETFRNYQLLYHHHKFHEKGSTLKTKQKEKQKSEPSTANMACQICQRQFTHVRFLNLHMRAHDEIRTDQCKLCKEIFETEELLRQHSTTHYREKRFGCVFCSKRFTTRGQATIHARLHTGELPFKCSQCDLSFRTRINMKRHMMAVHDENKIKPFKCQVCGKAFAQNFSLNAHMKIHTGEEHFECPICNKSLSSSKSGKKHMKAIHGVQGEDEFRIEDVMLT